MAKKLSKKWNEKNPNVLMIEELETKETLSFDLHKYPKEVQANFAKHGMAQKLGDAAAGKNGQEAVDSIMKVHEGLMSGNWNVRAPAAPAISKKSLSTSIGNLDTKEQDAAKALLEKLGISL